MRLDAFKLIFLACVVVLFSPGVGSTQPRPGAVRAEVLHYPDLILINGKIITVDKNFSIQQAVAIRDEKIFSVGSSSRIKGLAGPKTKVIDLKGRTVIPGLIDAHMHFLRAGFTWRREIRLDTARSVKEILNLVEKRVGQIRPGEWIITFGGWHESQLEEKRAPTREELDRVAPNSPVLLRILLPHPSTHFAVLNSAALKAVGITRETPVPERGIIEKDGSGEPTGVLRRAAVNLALPKLPRPTFQDKLEGLKLVMRDFHAAGLTSVIEMVGGGVVDEDYKVLFESWRKKELTIRTALNIYTTKLEDAQRWLHHLPMGFGDEWLKTNGLGEQLLGAVQDNIAPTFPLKQDGLEEYQKLVTEAAKNHWSIQQHTTLGTTAKAYLDIYEAVDRQYPIKDLRWSMAHIEMISEADLQRMKRLGMGASIQSRQVIGSELMKQAWGEAAASGPPIKKMVEMGLPVGAGTDATVVTPYPPFTTLWWMVTGKDWGGRVVRPQERLSRQEALRVHTLGSAWFSFDEKIKGSIEPGKLADLVVLSDDYLTVPEDKIRDIASVMTIVGGRIVYEKGK
jgi:predicted amidohydrolase YtcJ